MPKSIMQSLLSILAAAAILSPVAQTPAPLTKAAAAAAVEKAAHTAQILAIVKASPQLKIDRTVPATSVFDAQNHPYINVLGVPEGQAVGGYLSADEANYGAVAGGYQAIAVPLESDGSGGVFTQILFARLGAAKYTYIGYIGSGGHLRVEIKSNAIVATLPYYGAKDANCCPSKLIVQTYAIHSGKLKQVAQKMMPTPKPH
ncbi:MAG TPA: hypothetical protein VGF98_01335 [Candidatus Tumulicola sp.]|jgi:hypothetical protein